ncbi:MAG: hypothetical protein IPG46_06530 [Actinobacteria bacterium]|nr:hypothetical protein [Actinomycetota bacterium]
MMTNERTLELFTVIAGDGFTGRVALDATRWAIPDDPPQRRAIVVLRPEHAEAPFLPNIVVEVRPVVGVIDPGVGVPPRDLDLAVESLRVGDPWKEGS